MKTTNLKITSLIIATLAFGCTNPFSSSETERLRTENALLKEQIKSLGQTPVSVPDAADTSKIKSYSLSDLVDNTTDFKGKTVALMAHYDNGLQTTTLRSNIGSNCRFFATDGNEVKAEIIIHISKKISVPNAYSNDDLDIVFKCGEGDLSSGNEAVTILRHSDQNVLRGTVLTTK